MHLDDDTLKSKLSENNQFSTLLRESNIKMDPSVDRFKEQMDKDLREDDRMESEEKKELEQEEKD